MHKTSINILMDSYKSKKIQCLLFLQVVLFNLCAYLWKCSTIPMDNSVLYLTKSCSFGKSYSNVKAVMSGLHMCMQTDKSTKQVI